MPTMPKWKKSPDALVTAFDAAIPLDDRIEKRSMFGYPCVFTGGNMFAGLWQEHLVVRLSEADRGVLRAVKGAVVFEPMKGRAMKEYTLVPPSIVKQPKEVAFWVSRALDYALSLPAKAKKKPAAKKKAKPSRKVAKKR
jgi:TfoX/Sxy family transcriptional regulator of competence genes